jgi:tetratricopeptide (TPR) repeat protein
MENNLEYIDNYFGGNLGPDETKQFDQRIVEDRDFAEEVAFYLSAKQASTEEVTGQKKEWFRQLADQHASFPIRKRITFVRKLWTYAAVAAVIICIFFAWYLTSIKPTLPQQMAKEYIEKNLRTLPVTMGTEKDSIQDGLRLYNGNQLDSSLKLFENIIQRDSSNFSVKNYAGIVYLRLENYDKALAYFQDLEKYTSLYSNPATFYHALTLMKRNQPGDKQTARQLLQQVVQNDLEGKETAKQWLKKW